MSKETKDLAEALYPEDRSMEVAFDHPQIASNIQELRDHQGLTESQAEDVRKLHRSLLTGIVDVAEVHELHGMITAGLRRPDLTGAQFEERTQKFEKEREETFRKGRMEYGWAWDEVWARAKQIVQRKPGLVKLLHDANLDNSWYFWSKVA